MRELHTEILIDAPAEQVWSVLADLAAYPVWNPFITAAEGRLEPGARLRLRIEPPGGSPVTFRPRLLAVLPGRQLRWLGRVGVPGLFDGEHGFEIHPEGEGRVRLEQWERFGGFLVPFLWRRIAAPTRAGFEAMNAALKARAEAAGSL